MQLKRDCVQQVLALVARVDSELLVQALIEQVQRLEMGQVEVEVRQDQVGQDQVGATCRNRFP